MSVTLPRTSYVETEPELIDNGGVVGGAGSLQRINRLGNRWSLTVTLPPMPMGPTARGWIADLNAGMTEGVIARWRDPDFTSVALGVPVVAGANQMGSTINAAGFSPGAVVRKGQFFNVTVDGRFYLCQARAEAVAGSGGGMAIPIVPMLRASPADGSPIRFDPVIEGLLLGDGRKWTWTRARTVTLGFTVMEAE